MVIVYIDKDKGIYLSALSMTIGAVYLPRLFNGCQCSTKWIFLFQDDHNVNDG